MTDIGSDALPTDAQAPTAGTDHGLRYELFVLALTIYSLVIMVLLILPLEPTTLDLLRAYDNLICLVFLGDFAMRLRASRPHRRYLIHERGWLDLLGSLPSLGILRFTALFRLFRLSRLARIGRLLRQRQHGVVQDVLANRGQYASFVTVVAALTVLSISSVAVLQFEGHSPDANITTPGDAVWWAIVTITTVGYGDTFPVTPLGRTTGAVVMISGIGIIGALASILASFLVTSSSPSADEPTAASDVDGTAQPATTVPTPPAESELALLRARIEEMHATLGRLVDQHATAAVPWTAGGPDPGPPGEAG